MNPKGTKTASVSSESLNFDSLQVEIVCFPATFNRSSKVQDMSYRSTNFSESRLYTNRKNWRTQEVLMVARVIAATRFF